MVTGQVTGNRTGVARTNMNKRPKGSEYWVYRRFLIRSRDSLSLVVPNNLLEH